MAVRLDTVCSHVDQGGLMSYPQLERVATITSWHTNIVFVHCHSRLGRRGLHGLKWVGPRWALRHSGGIGHPRVFHLPERSKMWTCIC